MFNADQEDAALNEAIASAFADLKAHNADDEGYQKTLDQIVKLYKLKHDAEKIQLEAETAQTKSDLETDKHELDTNKHALDVEKHAFEKEQFEHQTESEERPFYTRVDPNVLLTLFANIAVARMVIKYEQTGVITSKVLSFMKKF